LRRGLSWQDLFKSAGWLAHPLRAMCGEYRQTMLLKIIEQKKHEARRRKNLPHQQSILQTVFHADCSGLQRRKVAAPSVNPQPQLDEADARQSRADQRDR